MNTGNQLRERERLGDVVIGAGIETADYVVFLIERGEHNDGRRLGVATEMRSDGVAASPGEADVEHDGVKAMRKREREARFAVGCSCYFESGLGEPFPQ